MYEWRDLQFTGELQMTNNFWDTSQNSCQKSAARKLQKEYSFIFRLVEDVWYGIWTVAARTKVAFYISGLEQKNKY